MFDLVISSHAVPQHVYPVDFPKCIAEMLRVMKPSGEIRMAPCVQGFDMTDEIKRDLEASGFNVAFTNGEGKLASVTIITARDPGLKDEAVVSYKKVSQE